MIAPDMATMLGFIFTDAAVSPEFLQRALSAANGRSFSCITVDGDTSTSDTVLAFATAGRAMRRSSMTRATGRTPSARRWPICATSLRCWSCAMARARPS